VLVGVSSIVTGAVVYAPRVIHFGHAGSIALAIITLPLILRDWRRGAAAPLLGPQLPTIGVDRGEMDRALTLREPQSATGRFAAPVRAAG
jgi:hypothetical protein